MGHLPKELAELFVAEMSKEKRRSNNYNEYITSSAWKEKSDAAILLANGQCEECGIAPAIHTHHLTYVNLRNEKPIDLIAVCKPCHDQIHNEKPKCGKFTLKFNSIQNKKYKGGAQFLIVKLKVDESNINPQPQYLDEEENTRDDGLFPNIVGSIFTVKFEYSPDSPRTFYYRRNVSNFISALFDADCIHLSNIESNDAFTDRILSACSNSAGKSIKCIAMYEKSKKNKPYISFQWMPVKNIYGCCSSCNTELSAQNASLLPDRSVVHVGCPRPYSLSKQIDAVSIAVKETTPIELMFDWSKFKQANLVSSMFADDDDDETFDEEKEMPPAVPSSAPPHSPAKLPPVPSLLPDDGQYKLRALEGVALDIFTLLSRGASLDAGCVARLWEVLFVVEPKTEAKKF